MATLADEASWPRAILDRDYNARASVPPEVFDAALRRYRDLSDAAYRTVAGPLDLVYDPASGQTLDLFGVADRPRPVFLFIHGGYWRMLSKRDSAFMATALDRLGIATAVLDYRLAPEVTLAEIVREVRAAAAFLWRDGARCGLHPNRIFAGGSSAGGHLTGALLAGGWHNDFGVPTDIVKGALPISGLFHLAPIANCFVQDWIRLDAEAVKRLSPAENLPAAGCPIVTAYAAGEPDGFKRQSIGFDRLWRQAGFASTLLDVPDRNHFDVVLELADENVALTQALARLIHGS